MSAKAEALVGSGKIGLVATGIYQAAGSKPDTVYVIEVDPPHCDCMGFRFRHTCKHLEAAMILAKGAAA